MPTVQELTQLTPTVSRPRRPIDDLEGLLQAFLDQESARAGMSTEQIFAQLRDTYLARYNQFRAKLKPAYDRIEELAETIPELKQDYALAMDQPAGSLLQRNLVRLAEPLGQLFDMKLATNIARDAQMLSNPVSRAVVLGQLGKYESKLVDGNNVDVAIIGASVHASNFITHLRFLLPDIKIGIIDENAYPGQAWLERDWFFLNNTNGPSRKKRNLPREKADLFPLGGLGAMRLPYISQGRWPSGGDVGTAIRWNLDWHTDVTYMNRVVRSIENRTDGCTIVAEPTDAKGGPQQSIQARIAIITGQTEDEAVLGNNKATAELLRREFNLPMGQASIYSFNSFSRRIKTPDGVDEFLRTQDGDRLTIGVIGPGDGGKTVVQYLLGQAPPASYRGRASQFLGARPKIVWFGQTARDGQSYSTANRGRYSSICAGYSAGDLAAAGRALSVERVGGDVLVTASNNTGFGAEQKYLVDKLVVCLGYNRTTNLTGVPGNYKLTNDSELRPVAQERDSVFIIGPSANIDPRTIGPDVDDLYRQLRLNENTVANWIQGPLSQRAAYVVAERLRNNR